MLQLCKIYNPEFFPDLYLQEETDVFKRVQQNINKQAKILLPHA